MYKVAELAASWFAPKLIKVIFTPIVLLLIYGTVLLSNSLQNDIVICMLHTIGPIIIHSYGGMSESHKCGRP